MEIYYVNGSFKRRSKALISVEERGLNFSDGVYELISYFYLFCINTQCYSLEAHRMFHVRINLCEKTDPKIAIGLDAYSLWWFCPITSSPTGPYHLHEFAA